jgi:hypothetical protein
MSKTKGEVCLKIKEMKRTKGIVVIKVEPFDIKCTVFTDSVAMIRYLNKYHKEDVSEDLVKAEGMMITLYRNGFTHFFLYLPKKYDDIIIAHETLHLTYEVFKLTKIEVNPDNHEIQTYLQGDLMKQIKERVYGIKG